MIRSSAWILIAVCMLANAGPAIAGDHDDKQGGNASNHQSCVLLRNGHVLFGAASKLGDVVTVTHDDGSKIQLAGGQVAHIGQSIGDLYDFRRENRFDGDLRRVQADIRWSLSHGLVREAAEDALHARSLDPTNTQTHQLLRQIMARMKQDMAGSSPSKNPDQPPVIQTVSHQTEVGLDPRSSLSLENNTSPLSDHLTYQFAAKIQPVLMNRCAGCHAIDQQSPREFQIHSALTSKWNPKTVARENLQAVLNFVDLRQPAASEIRLRAADGHGGVRKSFGDPDSSMMRNLDHWLSRLEPMDSFRGVSLEPSDDGSAAPALVPTDAPLLSPVGMEQPNQTSSGIPRLPEPIGAASSWKTETKNRSPSTRMRRMPKVDNPFDPEIFNRRFRDQ